MPHPAVDEGALDTAGIAGDGTPSPAHCVGIGGQPSTPATDARRGDTGRRSTALADTSAETAARTPSRGRVDAALDDEQGLALPPTCVDAGEGPREVLAPERSCRGAELASSPRRFFRCDDTPIPRPFPPRHPTAGCHASLPPSRLLAHRATDGAKTAINKPQNGSPGSAKMATYWAATNTHPRTAPPALGLSGGDPRWDRGEANAPAHTRPTCRRRSRGHASG